MLSATVKHAFERGIRVIGMVMLMEGVSIGERVMREAMDEINAELADNDQERRVRMGEDWVYLGYRAGNEAVLLGGLKGAAEYEWLIDRRGLATNGMAAQLVVHLFLVGLIILGNAAYFIDLWRKKRRRQ